MSLIHSTRTRAASTTRALTKPNLIWTGDGILGGWGGRGRESLQSYKQCWWYWLGQRQWSNNNNNNEILSDFLALMTYLDKLRNSNRVIDGGHMTAKEWRCIAFAILAMFEWNILSGSGLSISGTVKRFLHCLWRKILLSGLRGCVPAGTNHPDTRHLFLYTWD